MSTEKIENAWLKGKYPMAGLSGHSAFLQKKLAKRQKYFDSGDYQMARQTTGVSKGRQSQAAAPFFNFPTGEAIPTPESVPVRKTSIIQPKFHVPPPTSPPAMCPPPQSFISRSPTSNPSNS
uniref:Unkown protein n=1 Tax=Riptortus pedestris TaxID=329032 RepID=R4WT03_RIPPE|nr:unkown protein [Riptortus pedestris]